MEHFLLDCTFCNWYNNIVLNKIPHNNTNKICLCINKHIIQVITVTED